MPFGVKNAVAMFMDYMNKIFRPFLNKFVMIFIDYINIYSKTQKERIKHLKTLLVNLRRNIYMLNYPNVSFRWKVHFLGHAI